MLFRELESFVSTLVCLQGDSIHEKQASMLEEKLCAVIDTALNDAKSNDPETPTPKKEWSSNKSVVLMIVEKGETASGRLKASVLSLLKILRTNREAVKFVVQACHREVESVFERMKK